MAFILCVVEQLDARQTRPWRLTSHENRAIVTVFSKSPQAATGARLIDRYNARLMAGKKPKPKSNTIALNKRAKFDYFIEDRIEAGLVLNGWEVKALREGRGQLTDSYVIFKNSEAWLVGALIQPLGTVSTHFVTDPARTRKLLLHRKQLTKLQDALEQKGYTVVVTALYWKQHMVKCEVALAKGKKQHDKRDTEKERDWGRQKQRVMSHAAR